MDVFLRECHVVLVEAIVLVEAKLIRRTCRLKYQADPVHALYGQRGAYTSEYRQKHRYVRTGPPSHVPWTGGIIGGPPTDTSVSWTTGIEGMKSSRGEELTVSDHAPK